MNLSNNSFGYTMIELLVVIAAMTIMGVLAISNFGVLQRDQAIKKAFSDTQSFIRTAQTNATARVACPDASGAAGAAWMIEFDSTTSLKLVCQLGTDPKSGAIRSYPIAGGVFIQSITDSAGSSCSNPQSVSIIFAPLYGNTTFTSSGCIDPNTNLVKIRLFDPKTSVTRDITVDKGGAVYEQEN